VPEMVSPLAALCANGGAGTVSATVEREPLDAPGDDVVAQRQTDFIRTLARRTYQVSPALG